MNFGLKAYKISRNISSKQQVFSVFFRKLSITGFQGDEQTWLVLKSLFNWLGDGFEYTFLRSISEDLN